MAGRPRLYANAAENISVSDAILLIAIAKLFPGRLPDSQAAASCFAGLSNASLTR